jgi:predicted exporter
MGKKRFLIFLFIFPAIATASAYAVIYILTGAVVDSFSGPALVYLASIGPGLVAAVMDWLVAKTRIPAVIGTTLCVYVALVLYLAWDGSANYISALGLIGAIPAAVCSWLSRNRQTRAT